MTHLFLVRDGATVWHAENPYLCGRHRRRIGVAGHAQAERLANWASTVRLTPSGAHPFIAPAKRPPRPRVRRDLSRAWTNASARSTSARLRVNIR